MMSTIVPTTINDVPTSPCSPKSPDSISPVELDAKLQYYVVLYGARWPLIRAHMQCAFQTAFPAKYLENRWQQIQAGANVSVVEEVRSPLAALETDDIVNVTQVPLSPSAPNGTGIQERLPLKRCYDGAANSPKQPSRPPPPASPFTPPKALLGKRCPTFLLAPGSSLAAPDSVRRQLKAVYLASKLNENRWSNPPEPSSENASEIELHASDEEKAAIVALLARELAMFRKKGSGSVLSQSTFAAASPTGKAKLSTATARANSPHTPSASSGTTSCQAAPTCSMR